LKSNCGSHKVSLTKNPIGHELTIDYLIFFIKLSPEILKFTDTEYSLFYVNAIPVKIPTYPTHVVPVAIGTLFFIKVTSIVKGLKKFISHSMVLACIGAWVFLLLYLSLTTDVQCAFASYINYSIISLFRSNPICSAIPDSSSI